MYIEKIFIDISVRSLNTTILIQRNACIITYIKIISVVDFHFLKLSCCELIFISLIGSFFVILFLQEPKLKIMKTDIKLPKDDEDIKLWLSEVYRKR